MELAFGLVDSNLIDACLATLHQSIVIKLPKFISISPEPLIKSIVILILKANRDPVFGETPQRLGKAIVEFTFPLASEEISNLIPTAKESITVPPLGIFGISKRYSPRITTIPSVFGSANLGGSAF
jgi:hypothetical protein